MECFLFRMEDRGGYRSGHAIPMIVQTPDRGIVSSDKAPERIARIWARCNSLNTGDIYDVRGPGMKHIARYQDGQEVPYR